MNPPDQSSAAGATRVKTTRKQSTAADRAPRGRVPGQEEFVQFLFDGAPARERFPLQQEPPSNPQYIPGSTPKQRREAAKALKKKEKKERLAKAT